MDLGIWLGKTYEPDEHYMGTSDGIFTARTCRRMPSDGQWKLEAVKAVTEVLWNMGAGRLIGRPRHVRVQVLPSLPEAPTHSQSTESAETAADPPILPAAPSPPAPSDWVSSDPMTVDEEQTRVHEWRRHAKRQADVALEDLDPAMVLSDDTPGGLGRAVGALEDIEEREPSDLEEDDESVCVAGGDSEREEARLRGRLEDLKKMKEFKLYVVVPRFEALEKGWRTLKFRWVDKERPEVWRCRCVVGDFGALQPWRRDLFTPSSLPITNRIVDAVAESHGWVRLVADATNAFFHAVEDEDTCGEYPPEFKDQLAAGGKDTDVVSRHAQKSPQGESLGNISGNVDCGKFSLHHGYFEDDGDAEVLWGPDADYHGA